MPARTRATRPRPASAPADTSFGTPPHLAPVVQRATASGGRALDGKTERDMSAKFGHDFSSVRVHTDARAEDSAAALGANAFAVGSDIVFGAGQYRPGTADGERLLAHEMTHVVQQSRLGGGDWGRVSGKGDASEREADHLASQVTRGRSVQVQAAPQAAVARDGIPQLSTPANDAAGVGLGMCGMLPGWLGKACTVLGGGLSATQGPTDKNDPHYQGDQFSQTLGVGTALGSLAGAEVAGPLGLVGSAGFAAGHGVEWLGNKMIEGGIEKNPGQFGPDPFDMR